MDLSYLTDAELLADTKRIAQKEREIMIEVLYHLKAVCKRKLFSPKFQSPYEYATKELGYSSDQAQRRLSAMNLMDELPEIETSIADGSLNLTTIGLAQTFFRAESQVTAVSREEKLETLKSLEGQSTRNAMRTLIVKSSQPVALKPETVKPVSATMNEIKAYVDDETLELFAKLKGILAHKHPSLSNSELIKIMAQETFEKLNPGREPKRKRKAPAEETSESSDRSTLHDAVSPAAPRSASRRSVSVALKRENYRNAGGRCQNCGSVHALQDEHVVPFALGGQTTRENLKLLCRNCNQRERIKVFGYRTYR